MSNLLEKIDASIHYNSDGDVDVEAIVDVIVEELEYLDKRVTKLSRECGIADCGGCYEDDKPMTTAERCKEDNERI